jgi:hypothetical protein
MTHVEDTEALRAENERLRQQNTKLQRSRTRRERARRASVVGLVIIGCGLAALSVVAIWLRVTLLDTDRYVSTVAPIAAEPAVQKAVADKLDGAINSRVNFDALAREALPDRADVLAPAIQTGLQSFIRTRIDDFTRSQRFQDLWVEANRRAHTRIVDLLEGGRSKRLVLDQDTVYLDLSPAIDRVKTALQDRGLSRIASAIPPSVDGRIELVQSSGLVQVQSGVRLLKAVAIVLPLLALLCLAGSVWLTRPRRRGLLHAAIGVAVAMLLLIAGLAIARSAYLDALGGGALPRDAAADIFDTLATFLRSGVRIVVIVAVVLALVAFLAGMPLTKYASAGWSRLATSSRRRWIAGHRNALMLGAGGLGGIALLVRDAPGMGYLITVVLLVGLAVAAIAALGSQARDPVPGELGADDQGQHGHDHDVVGGHP